MEVLNLLIVMASMQLKPPSSEPGDGLYFMEIILDRLSHFAGGAMARLLLNYVNRVAHAGPSSGMLYSAYSYLYLFSAKRQEDRQPSPLADKSAMLLLILANQNPKHFANEFMEAIRRLQDSNDDGTTVKISFRQLYQTLRSTVSSEESCMILYPLLVHNRNFRTYIMSRSDPESLLLPVLKAIYEFSEQKGNYQQLYMLLIIVLLLSQDNDFIESIQKITVQSHTWYTERVVKSVSLGGLSILVLIRTVQTNLATYKDVYCHTLCAAILANLSNSVVGLNSVVAQRIVSFYEMVAKRYLKLLDQLGQDSAEKLPSNPSKTESVDHDFDTLIYGDLVALLLEMMNSIITYALKHNPELVYALLQKRDAFAPFREVPRLQDFVENIDKVIAHFHKKLQEADLKILSTVEVGEVIDRATKTWNASTLKVFSILKFRYEESPQEWQFSIPYVWQTVFNRSLIYWDDESALLIQGFMDERTDNLHQIL
ncbi:Dymeclin [Powellomyces hirtus]|nr:Dymeclin [Powellomyces hirtus]